MVLLEKPIKYFINDPNNHVLVPGALEVPPAPEGHYLCSLTMDVINNYSRLVADTFGDPNLNAVFHQDDIRENRINDDLFDFNYINPFSKKDLHTDYHHKIKSLLINDIFQSNTFVRTNQTNYSYCFDNMIPEYKSTTLESSEDIDTLESKNTSGQSRNLSGPSSQNSIDKDLNTTVRDDKLINCIKDINSKEIRNYDKISSSFNHSLKNVNNRLESLPKGLNTEVVRKRIIHNELEKKRRLASKDLFRKVMELLEPGIQKFPPKKIILSRAIEYIKDKHQKINSVVLECENLHKERIKLVEQLKYLRLRNNKSSQTNVGERNYNYV